MAFAAPPPFSPPPPNTSPSCFGFGGMGKRPCALLHKEWRGVSRSELFQSRAPVGGPVGQEVRANDEILET